MHIAQIAEGVRTLLLHTKPETFIYDLLTAYGKPKASVTRLQAGEYNISKDKDYVLWKSNVYFTHTGNHPPAQILEQMKQAEPVKKHKPRFIIATNFENFCAYDTKTEEPLEIAFVELASKFDFFLPWAGMEKSKQTQDSPADIKAAEKMAKLYDLILEQNPVQNDEQRHSLNVFLSRLLFCYFAEDTAIFKPKLFSKSIESHTSADGSDLAEYLQGLFKVLDEESREGTPTYYEKFPYVNGGLFEKHVPVPAFNKRSRELLIRCGLDLDWSEINPDIFGSMFQAVVDVEQRGNMGMHYTSYQNIMKVIGPLFLDDLYAEYEKSKTSQKKLEDLLSLLTRIKVFDPACGSGNFLIISYKELRKLEMEIFNSLSELQDQAEFALTGIQLNQFYGIELDDFAHEIAILAMWLAEHQMNTQFDKRFDTATDTLPLKPSGNIFRGNALEESWLKVCPPSEHGTFVLGNPPYLGSSLQSDSQKEDMERTLGSLNGYKKLDYIAGWFFLAANYVRSHNAKAAFVTTNSICQGEQVSILWPTIFDSGIEIGFAYDSFKWSNNAKKKAGVTCIIVGLRNEGNGRKFLVGAENTRTVSNINAYLIDYKNIFVYGRRSPIAAISPMSYGSKPADGGFLILSTAQKNDLIAKFPAAEKFVRKLLGTDEFLYSKERWCLWIEDHELQEACTFPPIAARIQGVRAFRLKSKKGPTKELAAHPNQFGEIRHVEDTSSIIVPAHSSENRRCIPMGFLDGHEVVSNSAYLVLNAKPFDLGILLSSMHMAWTRTVGGQLETRLRYSSSLCYNNFPFPQVSENQIKAVSACAMRILSQREEHSELSLDQMYEPEDMPPGLTEAHDALDLAVDRCYRAKPFTSAEERILYLFKLYEDMLGTIHA